MGRADRWSDGDEEWRRSTRGPMRIGAWLRQGPWWPAVARPRTAVNMQRRRRTVQWARALGLVRLAAKEGRGRVGAPGSASRVQQRSSYSLRKQQQELADGINGDRALELACDARERGRESGEASG